MLSFLSTLQANYSQQKGDWSVMQDASQNCYVQFNTQDDGGFLPWANPSKI